MVKLKEYLPWIKFNTLMPIIFLSIINKLLYMFKTSLIKYPHLHHSINRLIFLKYLLLISRIVPIYRTGCLINHKFNLCWSRLENMNRGYKWCLETKKDIKDKFLSINKDWIKFRHFYMRKNQWLLNKRQWIYSLRKDYNNKFKGKDHP
jgi:hypothetical protein